MSAMRTILATAVITAALLASGYYAMSRPAPSTPPPAAAVAAPPAAPVATAAPVSAPVASVAAVAPATLDVAPNAGAAAPAAAALEDIVSRAMPAVVRVEVNTAFGSGFFVRPDTVLTNVHVVTTNPTVIVRLQDGSTKPARVETTAPEFDIAVLRVAGTSPAQPTLTLGSAARARPGQEVIVLGTPMGLQNTVTRGIVSALRQTGQVTLVQTDAAVNPGNSGGPVLDREGSVLGIATMGLKAGVAQGLSFAVAIDHAQELLAGRHTTSSTETPLTSLTQAIGAPPATPAPSESDARREAGSRAYDQTVSQIARKADELDRYWVQFRRVCYNGAIDGGFDREWFALFEPRAMKGSVAQGCAAQFADAQRAADEVRTGLVAADEAARRADVYPGTRRDTLRRNRLDYPGWTR
jgi:S1-C subfamily serine protease